MLRFAEIQFVLAILVLGCVFAEKAETDFEFDEGEKPSIEKQAKERHFQSDDEDFLNDEDGSGSDEDFGSGHVEPVTFRPSVPGYPVFYRVTINITSIIYTSALSDRNSQEFQQLSQRLSRDIEEIFHDLPGKQLVTILQFSPGSVLVTLDLGSEGYNDTDVLRAILEEALQVGVIGSNSVAKEGFTFKPLDEQVTCPEYVGRGPNYLPRGGDNWANLMINNAFPCSGNVIAWQYYRLQPTGEAIVGVFRPVAHNTFLLVDRTSLQPDSIGPHTVYIPSHIPVIQGDFIGLYYEQNAPSNLIGSAILSDNAVQAEELYQNYHVQLFGHMITPGSNVDINSLAYQRTNTTFALRAMVTYGDEGARHHSCDTDEFTCKDGHCVNAIYVCDRQEDCPDGSDEQTCGAEVYPCLEGRFRCLSSGVCVSRLFRCDGTPHCPDGSDEKYCTKCIDGQYECLSGQCILTDNRCDGQRDCVDGSDEINCPPATCAFGEFRCGGGICIPSILHCDGTVDCPDGEDEFQCPSPKCSAEEFTCQDGTCIPVTSHCDAFPDCPDSSDENPVICVPYSGLCRSDQFECDDGLCIDSLVHCNGKADCLDNSDELGCSDFEKLCTDAEIKCGTGNCIDNAKQCDRVNDCGDNSDEFGCVFCEESDFLCQSGQCIPLHQRCDYMFQCLDGSDEENCPFVPRCRSDQFTCDNGTCLDVGVQCNGVADCRDLSDEFGCPCRQGEFTCLDGLCIDVRLHCDGVGHCADFSDEENCSCAADQFTCRDGRCIDSEQRCDRVLHCKDGSDEDNCLCRADEFTCMTNGQCVPLTTKCDRRIDCSDGSDEKDCQCRADEFTCMTNGQCVPLTTKCDRRIDCSDGSDEKDCHCGSHEFTCMTNGQCVPLSSKCDRRIDCSDGSDEKDCQCGADEFTCMTNGQCIPLTTKCDQRIDCSDGSDEKACPTCDPETEFQCENLRCIPSVYRCNGRDECSDQSDEDNCPLRAELVVNPQNLRVRTGQTAMFLCESVLPDSGEVGVRWSMANGQLLPPSARDDGRGRLTINNVKLEDEGDYVCSAVGVHGRFQIEVRLEVDFIGPMAKPPTGSCRLDEMACSNGQCLPRDYLCDGELDCLDGLDEKDCDSPLPCEPNEFRCTNGRCAMKIWMCDGDNDCGDQSDEYNCPTKSPSDQCQPNQFLCRRGDQCVPASYQCDGEIDCQDRSDEIGCSVPTIVTPPTPEIEVQINGTFTIYCEAIGVPTPLILWRLNWGHIPTGRRVTITSEGGQGNLVIRFARLEDAGAYTCEALNNHGSIFATPDAIVIVRRQVGICRPPRFNFAANRLDDCVQCFCFGHTETCYSSNLQTSQITMGSQLSLVDSINFRSSDDKVQYLRSSGEFVVEDFRRDLSVDSHYFSLPNKFLGNRLTSYGGDLSYQLSYDVEEYDIPTSDPDVIIEGNGAVLLHRRDENIPHSSLTTVTVPFVETSWERSDTYKSGDRTAISQFATRSDLMLALQNLSRVLIRATYDKRQVNVRIGNIVQTTAVTENTLQGRAVYVEDCRCPAGYSGTSCETCALGFYRGRQGRYLGDCVPCSCNGHSNDCDQETGECKSCLHYTEGLYCERCMQGFAGSAIVGTVGDCHACPCPLTSPLNQFSKTCIRDNDGEITCTDCPVGYTGRRCESCSPNYHGDPTASGDRCRLVNETSDCDPRGSLYIARTPNTLDCQCKPNVIGRHCDRCRDETFYLSDRPSGCIDCFCMGFTKRCQSTSWNRDQVYLSFTTNDNTGMTLTNRIQSRDVNEWFSTNEESRAVSYQSFKYIPSDIQYWRLPDQFLGNKLTSYGGNLRFTIKYRSDGAGSVQFNSIDPLVEIGSSDLTMVYRVERETAPNIEQSFSVPFYEDEWTDRNGNSVSRQHFIVLLTDVKFVLIRAIFSSKTVASAISDISLDIATRRAGGQNRAYAVEECNCPLGYTGMSCEACSAGYRRSINNDGLYLGICQRCECNGHSKECDLQTGSCKNCEHNSYGERCELCSPGYYGDARRGSISDCQKCPCPLTEAPNQFSSSCYVGENSQVVCEACPTGHTGARCENCLPGYQGNPMHPGDYCKIIEDDCECDARGSILNAPCDVITRQCQCKANVHGQKCSSCIEGYFNLQSSNQQGCLACYCSGVTSRCTRSSYYRDLVKIQMNADGKHSFSLTNRRLSRNITEGFVPEAARNQVSFGQFGGIQRDRESLFFLLPPEFRGDKLTAYGGHLRFTISYSVDIDDSEGYLDVDIEIISKEERMYLLFNPKLLPNDPQDYDILLVETSFRMLDGSMPTRQQFLSVFADIDAILIRATYSNSMRSVSMRNVVMEVASLRETGMRAAQEVEECSCPSGYAGSSCQRCAPGYLRVTDPGTDVRRCSRCHCYGHAKSCNPVTGLCLNCEDNTEGERCERCRPGFYGDPTSGTPSACRPCPCPLTMPENQFSPTCYLEQDGQVNCDKCPHGYIGRDCGTCAPNYVGNPREVGGRCTPERGSPLPLVSVHPITVREPVGSTVHFTCQVSGRGPFNVQWSRLDNRLLAAESPRSERGPLYYLTISNLGYGDEGRYACTATNAYGSGNAVAELKVIRSDQPIRVTIEGPQQITVAIGSTVRVVCSVDSYNRDTNYVLSWTKQDGRLPNTAIDQNGVLMISDIKEGEAGSYICTGSDQRGVDTATLIIRIESVRKSPSVRIQPRYLEVHEGQSTELRCIAEGFPKPTVRWTRGPDDPLPRHAIAGDGVFRISSVRKSDEAEYFCTATNAAGTASIRTIIYVTAGQPAPSLTIIIRRALISASPGSNIQLECYAQEGKDITLVWTRQGRLPPGSIQEAGILSIPNVHPSYSGTYVCTGTGPTGSVDSGSAVVSISTSGEAPNARVEPETQTVPQGTTGTLRCVVTGTPNPNITWDRVRGVLTSNHEVRGDTLRIVRAEMHDRGVYICSASNANGQAQSSAVVDIERRQIPVIEMFPEMQQTISLGGSALFQCRDIGGYPSPTVEWTRVGDKAFTSTTKVTERNGVIMFEGVTGNEQGGYICTATNIAGTVTSTASLVVRGPPTITISPGNRVTSLVGERVSIECIGDGDPLPTVFWRFRQRGHDVVQSTPFKFSASSTARLDFNPVSASDSGRYVCVAHNEQGQVEDHLYLSVMSTGSPSALPNVEIEGPDQVNVIDGQSVQLFCSATGSPYTSLVWRRAGGRALPPGHSVADGKLLIPRITSEYAGVYECSVVSQTGDVSMASVLLIVTVTPKLTISPSRVTALAGDTVTMQCQPTGRGPFRIEWQRVNALMPTAVRQYNGALELRQVSAADAGQYRCMATDAQGVTSDGYATVSVAVAPTVSVVPNEELRSVGSGVEFRCLVAGDPLPSIRWGKDGGSLPSQHQIFKGVLTLYNIQEVDAGRYTCTAYSEFGTATDHSYLRIQASPNIKTKTGQSVQNVAVGDRVEFECIVSGSPLPTIYWSRLEGPIPEEAIIGDGILVIPEVTTKDAGTYRCEATNVAGSVQSQVQLVVQSSPVISLQHDMQIAALATPATLPCDVVGSPSPHVSWTKKYGDMPVNHRVQQDGSLYIPRVRKEDGGVYECQANNDQGESTLHVKLVIGAFVPYFPQDPASYISYPPLNDVYLDLDIVLSFRPEATDGLLLFNGQHEANSLPGGQKYGDFVCFGMKGAYPEFRFDVGSGPAVIRGEMPLQLNRWHTVHLKRDRKSGTIQVNDESVISGEALGRFIGLDITQPLYLGGVPSFSQIPKTAGHSSGFVGSISQVKLKGVHLSLGGSAIDIHGVEQYDSCQDVRCHNGGSCERANTEHGFHCLCRHGHSGKHCQVLGYRCYQGLCGEGRCHDLTDQTRFRCICPAGFGGEECRQLVQVERPSFNKTSFIAYKPIASHPSSSLSSITISIVLLPKSRDDGFLLYNANNGAGFGEFIALLVKDGYFVFRFDAGSGPVMLQSRQMIDLRDWTTIDVNVQGHQGVLKVNNDQPVTGEGNPNTGYFDLSGPLYVGGIDPSETISKYYGTSDGFVGCIAELSINGRELDLVKDAVENVDIAECVDGYMCEHQPCLNGGQCLSVSLTEYRCQCPVDFTGYDCEIEINECTSLQPCLNSGTCHIAADGHFRCSCPIGYVGLDCETAETLTTEFSVLGDGYAEFDQSLLPHRRRQVQEVITFIMSTANSDGLLFWQGQKPGGQRGGDYLAVSLTDGFVEFRYNLGSGPAVLVSSERVNDGLAHMVEAWRLGRDGVLTVDQRKIGGQSLGPLQVLNVQGNLFFGGVPDFKTFTDNLFSSNFHGCLRDITIQGRDASVVSSHAISGVNLQSCLAD